MSERAPDQLRPIRITPDYTDAPLASALIEAGSTRVLCTASIEESVPRFRMEHGGGWLTAEYGMLPGSSPYRIRRAASRGKGRGGTTNSGEFTVFWHFTFQVGWGAPHPLLTE